MTVFPQTALSGCVFVSSARCAALCLLLFFSSVSGAATIGVWNFDEGAGQAIGDSSGNVLDGVRGSDATVESVDPDFISGVSGTGLNFSAAQSDRVTIANDPLLEPAGAITVELYARSSGPGAFAYLISKAFNGNASSYAFYSANNGGLYFYVTKTDGHTILSPGLSASIWDNSWRRIVGSYDGSRVRMYVDGAEIGGGTADSGSLLYNSNNLFIGSFFGSTAFNWTGDLDQVRIFDEALTPAEIDALPSSVPIPSAVWLFGSGLLALVGFGRRRFS